MKSFNKFRVGQVFELYGMDILENANLTTKQTEVSHSLKLNYQKLTKLENRQRRNASMESKKLRNYS